CTRERAPVTWAMTFFNLGNALRHLGERENDVACLGDAVDAYREALKERTRDHLPRDWARTQLGLGAALYALGQRETGTARTEEAVAACRAALVVFEDAKAAHLVETARRNLAQAEALLAERHG